MSSVGVVGFANGGGLNVSDDLTINSVSLGDGTTIITSGGAVSASAGLSGTSLSLASVAVTATAAELNYVDIASLGTGATSKAVVFDADGQFDGATAGLILSASVLSGSEANIALNGLHINDTAVTATAGELNILDGVTATAAELNYNDIASLGTGAASKAVVFDASGQFDGVTNGMIFSASVMSGSKFFGDGSGLSGISSDTVDTTTNSVSATRYIPFVDQATGAEGESLLIHSALSINPSTGVFGIAGSAPGLTVGAAVLTEAELETLDDVTAGTAAASKAVILDASKDISGLNDVAAASYKATDFTAYASKVGSLPLINSNKVLASDSGFIYSNDRGLEGYNYMAVSSSASGSGYIGDGFVSVLDTSGNDIFVADGTGVDVGYDDSADEALFNFAISGGKAGEYSLLVDQSKINFGADKDVELLHVHDTGLRLNDGMGLSFREGGINICSDATGYLDIGAGTEVRINSALSASGNTQIGGGLTAAGLGSATVSLTDDLMIIDDGASGAIKTTSLANYATAIAGAGMTATAGALNVIAATNGGINIAADAVNLDLTDLAAGAVDVAADSIAIVDADDSNKSKKESIVDLVSAMAGTGITATNGVLSLSAVSTPNAVADADQALVEGLNYATGSLTAARTYTLPATSELDAGEYVRIKMASGVSSANYAKIVISGSSGDNIDGDSEIRIESPYGAVSLYKVSANNWRVF